MPAKYPPDGPHAHQQGTITKLFIVAPSKRSLYHQFSKAFILKCSKPAETTLDQSSKGLSSDKTPTPSYTGGDTEVERKVSNMPRVIPRMKRESCPPLLEGWR